jgi:hypothetical protein
MSVYGTHLLYFQLWTHFHEDILFVLSHPQLMEILIEYPATTLALIK